MALAALAKLGGPPLVMLRHPHVTKLTALGGGALARARTRHAHATPNDASPPRRQAMRARAQPPNDASPPCP